MNIPAVSEGAQRGSWAATVGTAVALQWVVILALAGMAFIWGGNKSAMSLLAGGACVALPNALFAAWLTLRMRRGGAAGPAAMLGGELAKLGLTIALLVFVVKGNPGVAWLALIVGVIGALKAQWLALWFTRNL
jgi:F0F1-type ATP synthase assembly protein I